MTQLSFINDPPQNNPVNVASIPQRSPFRYPGGKTWLIPEIRRWISSYKKKPIDFYEPFAGGGIVGLTVAFEQLAKKVTLIELDENVAAVWMTILSDDNAWLADRILNFNLTLETVEFELNKEVFSIRERAFQTVLKNRIYHGGILAPGAGILKFGEGGKGIHSRWYPVTLSRRIKNIGEIRDRINFIHGDGLEFIKTHVNNSDAIFFIDPPYTAGGKKAGSRLYSHYMVDHEQLFRLASQFKNNFLMTYDNSNEVLMFAKQYGFESQLIAMNNTHHAKMNELLIGRDLNWIKA